ncbi:hypothetical protein [Streptobacillus moniliformis]|nr:hypothetical protein [Streptobacillus moniliformis]
MNLYKFSLRYMNYWIVTMVVVSFATTDFSNEYKGDMVKYF